MLRNDFVQQLDVSLVHQDIIAGRRRQITNEVPIDCFAHLADGTVQITMLGRQALQLLFGAGQHIGECFQLTLRQVAILWYCVCIEKQIRTRLMGFIFE